MSKSKQTSSRNELQPSELRYVCDPETFSFTTTDQLEPLEETIGQDRALDAINFGLAMKSFGYNIYISGEPVTGKKTLVRSLVRRLAAECPVPNDLFFVHNFVEPERPKVLEGSPGTGCRFRDAMAELVQTLEDEVPKAFKSEDFESRRALIIKRFQEARGEILEAVRATAREKQLAVKSSGAQIITIPIRDGQELTPEQFEALPEDEKEEIRQAQETIASSIQEAYRTVRERQLTAQREMQELEQAWAYQVIHPFIGEIKQAFADHEAILEYLEEVQSDLVENITSLVQGDEGENPMEALTGRDSDTDPLKQYEVNVIVDNCHQQGAPVISESNPTYRNLIGFLEREARMGTLYTDFTMVRAGSLLEANGGFLILDMVDLLMNPLAWSALKRALQDGEVRIQDAADVVGVVGTGGLRPEPVAVDLKVVLLGSLEHYNLLYAYDEDFQKLFKIKADFDTVMKKTEGHLEEYAQFVKKLCDKEELVHFDRTGVAALIEHSSRMVSDKTRLTLRFSDVADLVRESSYWAAHAKQDYVTREHVRKAIDQKIYRSNLLEERLQEMIDEGAIMIATRGQVVGQINGLSVYQAGDFAFGKPTRLTAQVSVGEKGIVNIEREARLSGRIHDKGVLILSGYLHGKYGHHRALSLYASICFEQSYGGVDGDSASSTELYAIVSALSGLPINQSIAVTGSINQKGEIQPIGGVNEKIEGFFDACRSAGLNGDQGVMIPHQNVQNLMLTAEVIDAVKQGQFHIYPVETVDQGMEILLDRPAGKADADGAYPKDSIHGLVQARLEEMAEAMKKGQDDDDDDDDTDEDSESGDGDGGKSGVPRGI